MRRSLSGTSVLSLVGKVVNPPEFKARSSTLGVLLDFVILSTRKFADGTLCKGSGVSWPIYQLYTTDASGGTSGKPCGIPAEDSRICASCSL